ncbi:MAG TPA: hypothetical protein VK202_11375, partial [Bacteroidia bacterium]|nr:hypothetical protein [Bacteroidia bacterium]
MKHTFISFLLILFLIDIASGQTKYWEKLGQKFALCENDSVFLRRHSLLGYFPQEIDRGTGFLENYNDSFLFEMEPGCVYGPFVLDTMAIYVKIIRADSSIRMRV